MLVEAVILAVVRMAANQPVPIPYFDSLLANAEDSGHFVNGEHSRLA